MARKRFAQITTQAVEVVCPHCGEFQPNPEDGSDIWTPGQLRANMGPRDCVGCDEPMLVVSVRHALVEG